MEYNNCMQLYLLIFFICLEVSSLENVEFCMGDKPYVYNYVVVMTTVYTCCILDTRRANLKTNFRQWTFAEDPLLLSLAIDKNEENHIREVRNAIFSKVYPTPFRSECKLASYSEDVIVNILDMSPEITLSQQFLLIASGGGVHRRSTPLAHRYGGHQFGVWAGQLGDGRAHILGEYVNRAGERWELQLKGSGLTPYSRDGDGRAVIRSSVREFLCSEAMHYLGIPTSRAASLVISDDKIWRDQFYNGNFREERTAVVLRLAQSWLRFGSFEILTNNGEIRLLQELTDFVIRQYVPDIVSTGVERYYRFFQHVVDQTAELIAKWQSVGFVHGVCNTDNFSILSITIDYGPFGFMDGYDPEMVPNTSDDQGRYSYENQPDVGFYNLNKLKLALQPLIPSHKQFVLDHILQGYSDTYKNHFMALFRKKLGLIDSESSDQNLVAMLLRIMADTRSDFTMTFRHLGDWDLTSPDETSSALWSIEGMKAHKSFKKWTDLYRQRIAGTNISNARRRTIMHKANPRYILRNWIAEDVIRRVESDDFELLREASEIFRNPYTYQKRAEELGYAAPPPAWAADLKVSCSS